MNVRIIMISVLCTVFVSTQAQTAEVDYRPMVEDGKRWQMQVGLIKDNSYTYTIDGDTLINGETWKKVTNSVWMPRFVGTYFAALREVDKKVYAIAKGSSRPRLLYDFNLNVGDYVKCGVESNAFCCLIDNDEKVDTLMGFPFRYHLRLESIDTVLVKNQKFRRFTLGFLDPFKYTLDDKGVCKVVWVEGVGSSFGPFAPWMPILPNDNSMTFQLECFNVKDLLFGTNYFYESPVTSVINSPLSTKMQMKEVYDLQGHRLNSLPQKGIYIYDGKKKLAK